MTEITRDAELAYQRIREIVLRQRLRPGEQTSVAKLASLTRLGRTPVKVAITRLQAEGLFTVSDRRGTFVRELNDKDVRNLFALRRVLETYGAEQAVGRVNDKQLEEMAALLDIMYQESIAKSPSQRSLVRFIDADVRFHRLVVAAADNEYLERAYAGLHLHLCISRYLHAVHALNAEDRHTEHVKMYECLKSRDTNQLHEVITKHINTVESTILQAMRQDDLQFPDR